MLDGTFWQRGKSGRGFGDLLCRLPGDSHADLTAIVEHGRVAIDDLERCDGSVALNAPNRLLTDTGDVGVRVKRLAIRTAWRGIRISQVMAFDPSIMAGSRRERGHVDVADSNNHGIARLCVCHKHWPSHFVSAANARSDHRTPASRGCISSDRSTVD